MVKKTILDNIIEYKQREVALLRREIDAIEDHPYRQLLAKERAPSTALSRSLRREGIAVIAEVKRRSPSAGQIAPNIDPAALARRYHDGGAAAISVLTDGEFFGGSLSDLDAVVRTIDLPVVRKEFIVDPVQIAEAAHHGAAAILLIVKVLGEKIRDFLAITHRLGMEAVCEVTDELELQVALDAGATLIGVNARDLRDFSLGFDKVVALREKIPDPVVAIAESGVNSPADVDRLSRCGYDAVLVGQSLVAAVDPVRELYRFRHPSVPLVKVCGVTRSQDAAYAVSAGADFIGVIAASGCSRSVEHATARDIAIAARSQGGRCVAVFIDEDADAIIAFCAATGIDAVQLHGDGSRAAYGKLKERYTIFYTGDGVHPIPPLASGHYAITPHGQLPSSFQGVDTDRPFFIAGGLQEGTVHEVVQRMRPHGVDVSSGLEGCTVGAKEACKIDRFIQEAHRV